MSNLPVGAEYGESSRAHGLPSEPIPSPTPEVHGLKNALSGLVGSVAANIYTTANRYRKGLALGTAVLALSTAIISTDLMAGPPTNKPTALSSEPLEKTPDQLHDKAQSTVEIQDKPFELKDFINGLKKMTEDEGTKSKEQLSKEITSARESEEWNQQDLSAMEAEFIMAARLSSGIEVNIYKSVLGDKDRDKLLEIDPVALDRLVTRTFEFMQNIAGSPINEEIATMKETADQGQVDLRLHMVLSADEALCIDNRNEQGLRVVNVRSQHCNAKGINARDRKLDGAARNQLIIVFDEGAEGPKNTYSDTAKALGETLNPNQSMTRKLYHELIHALVGLSSQNGKISIEDEHRQIVDPAESLAYESIAAADEVNASTPVWVEGTPEIR